MRYLSRLTLGLKKALKIIGAVLLASLVASFFGGIFSGFNLRLSDYGIVNKEPDILMFIYFFFIFSFLTNLFQLTPRAQLLFFIVTIFVVSLVNIIYYKIFFLIAFLIFLRLFKLI